MTHYIVSLGMICILASAVSADEPKPAELTAAEKELVAKAKRLHDEGMELVRREKFADGVALLKQAIELLQGVYRESEYPTGHPSLASCYANLGLHLQFMDSLQEARKYHELAVRMYGKLCPIDRYPIGHPKLAESLYELGFVLLKLGDFEKSSSRLAEAISMYRKLYPVSRYPNGHLGLAQCLHEFGVLQRAIGDHHKAQQNLEEALSIFRKNYPSTKYPNGHNAVSICLCLLGEVLNDLGDLERSQVLLEEAVAMNRKLYPASRFPSGHPILARSLDAFGFAVGELGAVEKALPVFEEAISMYRKLYPDGHSAAARLLNNLAQTMQKIGALEKAISIQEQAVAMYRRLYPESKYPDGTVHFAHTLNNLGILHIGLGTPGAAEPILRQALAMYEKHYPPVKFPDGHPHIAASLNNIGTSLRSVGKLDQATTYFNRSLAMRLKLFPATTYPRGHPDLAVSLTNIGLLLQKQGKWEEALRHCDLALKMNEKLYPETEYPGGHRDVRRSLNNVGALWHAKGDLAKAQSLFERSLALEQRRAAEYLETASEADALEYLQNEPLTWDALISVTRFRSVNIESLFRSTLISKAQFPLVLERRHADARVLGTSHAASIERLKSLRRQFELLLTDSRLSTVDRQSKLVSIANERDKLEREILQHAPTFRRWRETEQAGATDFAKSLPNGAVFVVAVRYARFEFVDNEEKRIPCYVAFLIAKPHVDLTPNVHSVVRIELGDAAPIDSAIAAWRTAIEDRRDVRGIGAGEVEPMPRDSAGARELLRKLVWEPIAKHLPPGTKTIYLAPDGDLARLPWAALPTGKDRVLLEDYEVAVVPHGMYLLEQLKYPRKFDGKDSALVLGGVEYKSKVWPELPGTSTEMNEIVKLAPAERDAASGSMATADRVGKGLAKFRYAHIATHGYFDADGFASEKKREDIAMKNRQFGDETRRVASKNPLGFVGLVLANGEVMSGLSILDLPLENLKLVTLSACETGLGEYTGGKGVENLQMAFHVAGAQNVIASLWKVNDAATAALMAKFYHELWENKKPPITALREAQLFIYYNPDKILDILGERGAPKRTEALALKPSGGRESPDSGGGKNQGTHVPRSPTKLWAAFVLSGVGK